MKKYKLEKAFPTFKYYEVYLNGDSNDADYIGTLSTLSQKEFDECINDLITLNDICNERHALEEFTTDCWCLNIPRNEYGNCHTLEKISIRMFDTDGNVYNVIFD
jgi:hypothetical protein